MELDPDLSHRKLMAVVLAEKESLKNMMHRATFGTQNRQRQSRKTMDH